MDTTIRLERYLKLWNLTLRESRIAGKGNKFEVIHQFPDHPVQRILGEFMLHDEDLARMGGYDLNAVAAYIMDHVRKILQDVKERSDMESDNWQLQPSGLI